MNFFKISAIFSALMLIGCSAPQDTYTENAHQTQSDNISMETVFTDSAIIYSEENITEDKNAVLSELHGLYSSDEFLLELDSQGVDLSVIENGTISFNFDSSIISTEGKELIKKHAQLLKASNKLKVILEGHTDSTGDRSYNLKLSERRALAVKAFAILEGVQPEQIEVISYGEEKLLNAEGNLAERSLNRRAEFVYK